MSFLLIIGLGVVAAPSAEAQADASVEKWLQDFFQALERRAALRTQLGFEDALRTRCQDVPGLAVSLELADTTFGVDVFRDYLRSAALDIAYEMILPIDDTNRVATLLVLARDDGSAEFLSWIKESGSAPFDAAVAQSFAQAAAKFGFGLLPPDYGPDSLSLVASVHSPSAASPTRRRCPPVLRAGVAPRYPGDMLRRRRDGQVNLAFVVDTGGAVEMNTLHVLDGSDQPFVVPMVNALRKANFAPAELDGVKVRAWIVQAFKFKMPR